MSIKRKWITCSQCGKETVLREIHSGPVHQKDHGLFGSCSQMRVLMDKPCPACTGYTPFSTRLLEELGIKWLDDMGYKH